jgi:hypothetical protein
MILKNSERTMDRAEAEAATARVFRKLIRIVGQNEAGQYSSMWSFKAGNDGFYFSSRSLLNVFKVSLHANNHTGYLAFDRTFFYQQGAEGALIRPSRTVHEWRLPEPGNSGAIQAASIKLPADWMRAPEHEYVRQLKAVVFGIEPSRALEIGVFLSKESQTSLEDKFVRIGMPLVHLSIDGWCDLSVVVRSADFDESILAKNARVNSRQLIPFVKIEAAETVPNLNMVLFNGPKDGEALQIVDVGGVSVTRNSG